MSTKNSAKLPPEEIKPLYADEIDDEFDFPDDEDDFEQDDDYSPFNQESLSFEKDARWELEEDETLKEIMRNIDNKVNKTGQRDIYAWFKVNFIKSFALSNLDDQIINMYVMDTANTFNREALMKMRKWDLKSSDLPTLSIWVREAIHIFLRRSYKDGERKHRTSRYGGMNDQTDYGEQTKSGFSLGDMFPKKQEKRREQPQQERYDDAEYM